MRGQAAGGERDQQMFFENKVTPYYTMVELLTGQNKLPEALGYAERAKGRLLLDVLRSGKVNLSKAMTVEEGEKERKLSSEVIALNTRISSENARHQRDEPTLSSLTND